MHLPNLPFQELLNQRNLGKAWGKKILIAGKTNFQWIKNNLFSTMWSKDFCESTFWSFQGSNGPFFRSKLSVWPAITIYYVLQKPLLLSSCQLSTFSYILVIVHSRYKNRKCLEYNLYSFRHLEWLMWLEYI